MGLPRLRKGMAGMGIYEFSENDAFRFARETGAAYCRRGEELHFQRCPYCLGGKSRDRETFSISLRSGQFKCLRASCGAHGNMVTLARDFGFSLGDGVDAYYGGGRTFRKFVKKEKPSPKPSAVVYLEGRGISGEVTGRYGVTTKKGDDGILVFPFYDEHKDLCFVKYRKMNFDKGKDKNKEWCEKGCKPILFGMDQCKGENKTLVLTEGQIDSLSVAQAGVGNAVSVPNGAKGFTWIPYCWDFLSRFDTLVVFGDYEHGRITLLEEMGRRFHGAVKHVREEDYKGCKDANELLQAYGEDAVRDAVAAAVPVDDPKIKRLADVGRADLSRMEKIPTGMPTLDRLLGGFYFGQLILLTGERGLGKSTLVSQFGTLAVDAGYPVFFYSGELMDWYFKAWFECQTAGERHINRMQSSLGYVSYKVDGAILPQMEEWYREKAYIYDNGILGDGQEEETLTATVENAVRQYGCRVIVLDNLMTAIEDDMKSDLYRAQTRFVKRMAALAKKYDALVFLLAHPRKTNGSTFGNDDVAGSSNITNLADVVMRYGRPKGEEDKDGTDRALFVYKNRLTGRTNRDGIRLCYQEGSKRIAEEGMQFGWELGWERDKFVPAGGQEELVFD